MSLSLTSKIVRLHEALEEVGLPHAFGGALALAFCTAEPRATKDVDVNVFIGVERMGELVAALPAGVEVSDDARVRLGRDAQARLWWDGTPVDVFLSNHPFHDHAEANVQVVPFAGVDELPVLACTDLAVFKTFYARPKDVLDVATMVSAGSVDLGILEQLVGDLLAERHGRNEFFARVSGMVEELG